MPGNPDATARDLADATLVPTSWRRSNILGDITIYVRPDHNQVWRSSVASDILLTPAVTIRPATSTRFSVGIDILHTITDGSSRLYPAHTLTNTAQPADIPDTVSDATSLYETATIPWGSETSRRAAHAIIDRHSPTGRPAWPELITNPYTPTDTAAAIATAWLLDNAERHRQ